MTTEATKEDLSFPLPQPWGDPKQQQGWTNQRRCLEDIVSTPQDSESGEGETQLDESLPFLSQPGLDFFLTLPAKRTIRGRP